jgi:hypothetical protein
VNGFLEHDLRVYFVLLLGESLRNNTSIQEELINEIYKQARFTEVAFHSHIESAARALINAAQLTASPKVGFNQA